MSYLTEDEFYELPDQPLARWLAIEESARGKLLYDLGSKVNEEIKEIVKQQYMATVYSSAKKLGVKEIGYPSRGTLGGDRFETFFRSVMEVTTAIRVEASEYISLYSTRISETTEEKISQRLSEIREICSKSDISETKKKNIDELLGEIEKEISRPVSSASKIFAILALVGGLAVGSTAFLADLPNAIGTITILIGQEKTSEPKKLADFTEELKLIEPPKDEHAGQE